MPFSHLHHRILQPLERGENFREGAAALCISTAVRVLLWSDFHISSTPGSVGDRHLALHRAFHPADKRRHSARSLERCGVLPEAPVGETPGNQCELSKVGFLN